MGVRFGHWLGCAVVVDSKEPEKQEVSNMVPISSSIPVGWRGKLFSLERIILTFIISPRPFNILFYLYFI